MSRLTIFLSLLLALTGCAIDTPSDDGIDMDNDPPLHDVDELIGHAPDPSTLPEEGKADEVYPETFDLVHLQSPVRNQSSRGVCSIFSTVGLMEHLYIAEGTITEPDFSEQFLQWSAKFEAGTFRNSGGSNASSNLRAISQYGIVEEADWPYETSPWTTADDPECEGDSRPTRCYTNGEPPEAALSARRWRLPSGRYLSNSVRSIKSHMTSTDTGVVVGLTFFYQAWNHRRSPLPTNSDYFANGWVLAPNTEDSRVSREEDRRAGHSILLVGWNDNLSVQKRDEEGNPVVDEAGEPVMETGFFLFKNSWGTGSFGTDNEFGPGYGWISYDYVTAHGRAQVSGKPRIERPEICDNGEDDDGDGDFDCADSACATDPACEMMSGGTFENDSAFPIPDNDPTGVRSPIRVGDVGTIRSLSVSVDIEHTYRGDLRVLLLRDGEEVVLWDRQGGSANDLQQSFDVTDFEGQPAEGTWELYVSDNAGVDTGTLNGWTLEIAAQ